MKNKLAAIDSDTILYQAAAVIQENPITVEHKLSKRQKEYKNITAFREYLKTEKGRGYSEDDFTWEAKPKLTEDISHALFLIKNSVDKIIKNEWVGEYRLFVGGEGNFRKDLATILPYKGNRPPKPLAFQECYDYFITKYKSRIDICHGKEAEDGVVTLAYPSYLKARQSRNKEDMDVVVCGVDKDLRANAPGFHFNYSKPDEGVFWLTDREVAYNFWTQMLIGDRGTDNIPGLTVLHDDIRTKWGVKKGKGGCGDAGAKLILAGAETEKEMATRVIEAYRVGFKDDWQKHFDENGILLRMQRYEGEMWNATQYTKDLGVDV